MKKLFLLLAFLIATITYAQTPARHYGGVILGSFAADPTGVMAGQIYWNTTSSKFRAYNGSTWSNLVSGGGGGSQDLESVLSQGNFSGTNDISMTTSTRIYFDEASGTTFYIGVIGGVLTAYSGDEIKLQTNDGATIGLTDIIDLSAPKVNVGTSINPAEITLNGLYRQSSDGGGDLWSLNDIDLGIKTTIQSDQYGNDVSFFQNRNSGLDTNIKHMFGYHYNGTDSNLIIGAEASLNSSPNNIKLFKDKYLMNNSNFNFNENTLGNNTNKTTHIVHGYSIEQTDENENWGWRIDTEDGLVFSDGGSTGLTAVTPTDLFLGNNSFRATLSSSSLNNNRTFQFPNASGTIALTSDVPNYSDWLSYSGSTTTGDLSLKFGDYNNNTNGWYISFGQINRSMSFGDIDELDNSTIFSIDDKLETYTFGGNNNTGAVFDVSAISNVNLTFPSSSGQLAVTSDIPSTANFVDLTTTQTIGGVKTFTNDIVSQGVIKYVAGGNTATMQNNGTLTTDRTFDFPDNNGTLALTSVITTSNLQQVTDVGNTTTNNITSTGTINGSKLWLGDISGSGTYDLDVSTKEITSGINYTARILSQNQHSSLITFLSRGIQGIASYVGSTEQINSEIAGIYGIGNSSGGRVNATIGGEFSAEYSGSSSGGGILASLYGVKSDIRVTGNGSIEEAMSFKANTPIITNTGSVKNTFGLYIEDQDVPLTGDSRAIHIEGNGDGNAIGFSGDGSSDFNMGIYANGINSLQIKAGDVETSGGLISGSFVKRSATSDDILLGDGTTTSLSSLGGGGKFVDGTDPLDAVYTTGDVGIGTTTPSNALDVVGDVEINGRQITSRNRTGTYTLVNSMYVPDMGNNNYAEMILGREESLYNRGTILFNYVSNQNPLNNLAFGFFGNGTVLKVKADGDVEVDNGDLIVKGDTQSESFKYSIGYTVAGLPGGVEGQSAYVTDALSPTYLGAVTGGGSVVCPVFYNGTQWICH